MKRSVLLAGLLTAALAAPLLLGGCSSTFLLNQTKERTGTVNVQFVNTTPFTVLLTAGSWDALDLNPPGTISIQQSRLTANSTPAAVSLTCRRNVAVGTQALVDRVLATKTDETTSNFDTEAFGATVRFSSAAANTTATGLPTEGTAQGVEVLLGVNYSCGDTLIFTFVQDPDAEGGFRIDYELLRDKLPGQT